MGLVAGAAGEMAGYLLGGGNAVLETARMELFKVEFVTERERRKLEAWSADVTRHTAREPPEV